jgi:hypothetical protein
VTIDSSRIVSQFSPIVVYISGVRVFLYLTEAFSWLTMVKHRGGEILAEKQLLVHNMSWSADTHLWIVAVQ